MNTKLLLAVYCCYCFICCQHKNEKREHDLFINCLTNGNLQDNSTLYGGIIIFCTITDTDKLGYINISRLCILFNLDSLYQKMDYSKFIKGVILRDIILDKNEVEGRFRLNNRIISEFNKIPFGDFLVKYTKYERENECSLGNDLSHDEKMTVIYCLYQNNYYTGFDDVIGLYLSEKIDLILQRTIEEIDIYY